MNIIEVSALTKFYGPVCGVQDINFQVEAGEIFGFLGPNGAGKTTTIRLLMDLIRPDCGQIQLFGDPLIKNQVEYKECIGYLPGDFRPYSEMTGQQLLNYFTHFRSRPPVLQAHLLRQLNLLPRDLTQRIKHLSHGTRQKLGIVLALSHQPDLAILDEPTLGLDPLVQEAFYEILYELQQEGKTIFLSSHILPEIEKICQRVAIIRSGKIVVQESIQVLKQKHPRRLKLILKNEEKIVPPTLPNSRLTNQNGCEFNYIISGDVHEVLKKVMEVPVTDIVFPEPDLEDIFLEYYAEETNAE
ncbi:ABC transporter ATP-binding protein [candidate division KSB1 bacterium]|nr:ABC transporter ATP-binding protein [candidate division KSB1 bacterium]